MLTLGNRNFKHSKPSEFNDSSDLTIEGIFPEDEETALTNIKSRFHEIILRNLDRTPTCESASMREKIACIQSIYRKNPEIAKRTKEAGDSIPLSDIYDLERVRLSTRSFVNEMNEFFQGYRVLCVSEKSNSKKMWALYAQEHQGIALAITPKDKESKYNLFRPVAYRARRPCLFDAALSFFENGFFGDQEVERTRALNTVIYTKTLEWKYEKEHRLVIPVIGTEWNTMPFHAEEVVALYLGGKISKELERKCVGLAKAINPEIEIYRCVIGASDDVAFCRGD